MPPGKGQSVYSVPPGCFSGTPRCTARGLDSPRLQRGKLRLGRRRSSRKHGRELCCGTKKQAPSRTPPSTLSPSAVSSAGTKISEGHQKDGNPRAEPARFSLWPTRPRLPAPTPDQRRQDFALSRTASQGQRCGRTKPPAGLGTFSCHLSPGCPVWRTPRLPGPGMADLFTRFTPRQPCIHSALRARSYYHLYTGRDPRPTS